MLHPKYKKIITNAVNKSNPKTVIFQLLDKTPKDKHNTLKTALILKFITQKYISKKHYTNRFGSSTLPSWIPEWIKGIVFFIDPSLDRNLEEGLGTLSRKKDGPLHQNDLQISFYRERRLDRKYRDKLNKFINRMRIHDLDIDLERRRNWDGGLPIEDVR